jgi:hypothetical protein
MDMKHSSGGAKKGPTPKHHSAAASKSQTSTAQNNALAARSRPLLLLETARLLQLAGRLDHTHSVLLIAVVRYPQHWKVFLQMSLFYLHTHQPKAAKNQLLQALRVHPTNGRYVAMFSLRCVNYA